MDRDVSEINVKQVRVYLRKNLLQLAHFAVGNLPGRVPYLFEPESPREVGTRLSNDRDFVERIALRFLPFLRDDERLDPLQRSDLPVDVEHLRLEECRAIAGDYWSRDVSRVRHTRYCSTERSRVGGTRSI